jgi:hypothetical protein
MSAEHKPIALIDTANVQCSKLEYWSSQKKNDFIFFFAEIKLKDNYDSLFGGFCLASR